MLTPETSVQEMSSGSNRKARVARRLAGAALFLLIGAAGLSAWKQKAILDVDESSKHVARRALSTSGVAPARERVAIVGLVSNLQKDIDELCVALKTLILLHGDELEEPKAPVLIFNEGNLLDEQISMLAGCTERVLEYPIVDFDAFPAGFDPEEELAKREGFRPKPGRSPWGYHQMISFWNTRIFKHPALEPFDVIMRIDSDSCFTHHNHFLPHFPSDGFVYHSNFVGVEHPNKFVSGLYEFTVDYIKQEGITPANPDMWAVVQNAHNVLDTLPLFQTNFELTRKTFMQREDVAKWLDALTEKEPFGVYRHRWGDAVTRFLTAAMFAEPGTVQLDMTTGYFHRERCPQGEEMEDILTSTVLKDYEKNFL